MIVNTTTIIITAAIPLPIINFTVKFIVTITVTNSMIIIFINSSILLVWVPIKQASFSYLTHNNITYVKIHHLLSLYFHLIEYFFSIILILNFHLAYIRAHTHHFITIIVTHFYFIVIFLSIFLFFVVLILIFNFFQLYLFLVTITS
jgi:hypothetical protein